MDKEGIQNMVDSIEAAAYEIACKMIDCGYIESEPEGLQWEHEITTIIRNKLGL